MKLSRFRPIWCDKLGLYENKINRIDVTSVDIQLLFLSWITKANVIRYFVQRLEFIKKAIEKSDIKVLHIFGQDYWADYMTRVFGAKHFEKFSKEMFQDY